MWAEVRDLGSEQNRSIRHQKRFAARFGPRSLLHDGQTLNLSDRGIALKTPSVYPSGTKLRISVKPSDQPAFDLEAVVVWAQDGSHVGSLNGMMGLRLLNVDDRYIAFVTKTAQANGL